MSSCIICATPLGDWVYKPIGTRRDLRVYVCPGCGVAQSWPRVAQVKDLTPSISCDADYGNLRIGKLFATGRGLEVAGQVRELRNVLDVGASRGSFVSRLTYKWPKARITAIEPDIKIIPPWANHCPGIEWISQRIENVDLPRRTYDFIYLCHTLEHLSDPLAILRKLKATLHPAGLIYVEVPNITNITRSDAIEEFFIDKHLTHFSPPTLWYLLCEAGLGVSGWRVADDSLGFTAHHGPGECTIESEGEGEYLKALIVEYAERLLLNRALLKEKVTKMNELMSDKKVVVWGVGRLYDVLVKAGLEPPAGLVDSYLPLAEVDGLPVGRPEMLPGLEPEVVFICSRSYEGQIQQQCGQLVPEAEVITFNEVQR